MIYCNIIAVVPHVSLKDLEHPNIVQYLGFEETPETLNMCAFAVLLVSLFLTLGQFPGIRSRWNYWKLPSKAWKI
jgi:hypothetical protein